MFCRCWARQPSRFSKCCPACNRVPNLHSGYQAAMAAWPAMWLSSTHCPACNLAAKHALWLLGRRWCAACVAQHAIWLPSLHFARILAGCHACARRSDMQCGCPVCILAAWQARVASGGMQFGCSACLLAARQARVAFRGIQGSGEASSSIKSLKEAWECPGNPEKAWEA